MSPNLRMINPPELGAPRGYTNGVIVPANCRLLFVAGQVGWNEQQEIVSADFVEQLEQALRNVLRVVAAAGGGPDNVVRLVFYVRDLDAYLATREEVGAAYRRTMGRHFPAMSLVEVSGLVEEGSLVEIEATAALPPEED
jgi:enamine deaminase RidA (YjgF/YER057c/UK114 family)